jgi:transcriptional regulator
MNGNVASAAQAQASGEGRKMAEEQKDWLHGTLDTLILQTLARGARHGYGIARWIEEASEESIRVEEGSLYPALYRMEKKGWLRAEWGTSELGRRAKFYALTAAGRRRLRRDAQEWSRFAEGVARILRTGEAG